MAISARVKHINRISFEEGTAMTRLAVTLQSEKALKMLQEADERFKETIQIKPNDYRFSLLDSPIYMVSIESFLQGTL